MKQPVAPLLLPTFACLLVSLLPASGQGGVDGNVHLKVNDAVKIEFFDEADLNATARIMKSGEIALQLIGQVKIAGLTVKEADEAIRELYARDFLKNPKFTLTVAEYSEDFISVLGSVRAPGQFAMPENGKLDLASALALAGGTAPDADPSGVQLTRGNGVVSTHSTGGVQNGKPVQLQPGDRITVRQSPFAGKTVKIAGNVGRPGPVVFPLDGKLTLFDAILSAGDFTEMANKSNVRVNRKGTVIVIDFKKMMQEGNPPYLLQPGDTIEVVARRW